MSNIELSIKDDFIEPKIIFQEIVQESQFVLDRNTGFYCNDTCRIITGKCITFLVGILNSKLFFFSIKHFYGGGALGKDGVRMKHSFFENFPCIPVDKRIENLVEYIMSNKNAIILEKQIDCLVYKLYGLSDEEVIYIESCN